MKETTFYIVVGILAAVSLASGFLGWHFAKRQEEKENHIDGSSFRQKNPLVVGIKRLPPHKRK